ncbi:hypothetical protein C0989_003813 [Termitomyces sp. Mn162]|nr:hypothetical protein C0989_003813 [Termitomyces sp. Mn162]
MSAYDIRPGGSLKLKGGVAEGGIVKKKKKKTKSKADSEKNEDREKVKKLLFSEDKSSESPSGSGSNSPAPSGSSSRKTEAEKRFEEAQKRRLAERVAKLASKTHKERVSEFNTYLETLSEHHDIPKKTESALHNASTDQIATTVASVLAEYFKTSERTVFWNDDIQRNVDPFESLEGGFFTASWDFKLKILRQLVELQLCHNADIKATIDRAWGVSQSKHKKKDATTAPPDPSDPKSQAKLQLLPIGQDSKRTRYWVGDALIENLKTSKPPDIKKGEKRSRFDAAHIKLIATLEGRIDAIDEELARVAKVRRRIEQREQREHRKLLLAQAAEVRETRTRRQTQRPDYVYANTYDSEAREDADEYTYQEEDVQDEEFDEDDFLNFRDVPNGSHRRRNAAFSGERRRSTRTAAAKLNSNGKRESSAESWSHWRGERRSSRLAPEANLEGDRTKRARTEDSTLSTNSAEAASVSTANTTQNGIKLKNSGAAALKPNEIALEQIAGKKKSKFWVYAVEPIPNSSRPVEDEPRHGAARNNGNGSLNGDDPYQPVFSSPQLENGTNMDLDRSLEGSLSPLNS